MNQIERIEKLFEDFRDALMKEFGLIEPVKRFKPPMPEDVSDYFHDNGYSRVVGLTAWRYYSPDWVDSNGKKILNWKQKMRGVWFKEENKNPVEKKLDETNKW